MKHESDVEKNANPTDKKGYFCRCGLHCSTLTSLDTHILNFNRPRPFLCEICRESFVSKKFLRSHVELKHQVKMVPHWRVICGDCGQYFGSHKEHKRHRQIFHDSSLDTLKRLENLEGNFGHGVASYIPPKCTCGKTFPRNIEFAHHLRHNLDDGIKDIYKCCWCTSKFSYRSSLKRHMEVNHKVIREKERLICGVCKNSEGKWFLSIDGILEHFKVNHPESVLGHIETIKAQ